MSGRFHGISEKADEFMRDYIKDKGPFKVKWIGKWPCGGVNVYLDAKGIALKEIKKKMEVLRETIGLEK